MLAHNRYRSKLPEPRVPVFDGNPIEYRRFISAFESLLEARTFSSTDRLYYLEQFTAGDVKELVRSCHYLPPDEGYDQARWVLKKKFGDEHRVASAYETKALNWPNIRPEDEWKNSKVVSTLVRYLFVSDLDENEYVSLPILYTRLEIPVSSDDIPTQGDIDQWPHLQDVFIPRVHAEVGLLIATDIPEALDPPELIQNDH
ncbi:uncharacterized protein LOC141864336 [Acropora palmata]|uniref:uncharacterized protein LOC141864336 n=1 Tax=Acropora palmata TaxID=6131 RepID=UPI003DA119E4